MTRFLRLIAILATTTLAVLTLALTVASVRSLHALTYGAVNSQGTSGIYIYDIRTSISHPLLDQPHINEMSPRWSPDGTQLLFMWRHRIDSSFYVWRPGEADAVRVLDSDRITGPRLFWSYDGDALMWQSSTGLAVVPLTSVSISNQEMDLPSRHISVFPSGPGNFVVVDRASESGTWPIYKYHMADHTITPLVPEPPCPSAYTLSVNDNPMGEVLAVYCEDTGPLYRVNLTSGNVHTVTDALTGTNQLGQWSDDGAYLITQHTAAARRSDFARVRQYRVIHTQTGVITPVLERTPTINTLETTVFGVDWLPEAALDAR
ncbi:MAG: WD40 repeat domain-containing protein [Chloroflexota bacterium]